MFRSCSKLYLLLGLWLCLSHNMGCGGSPSHLDEGWGIKRHTLTLGQAAGSACSTSAVNVLSQQLFQELNCLRSGTLTSFAKETGYRAAYSHVNAFVQTAVLPSLRKVLKRRPGQTMTVTSALRSLAQQYLLYQWYRRRRCGIGLAASPGNSNHESALALDVRDYNAWKRAFQAEGWRWLGARDPVHFDYRGSGVINIRGLSIKAFQRLWNKNNPSDKIAEDGLYGPNTEARLAKSPAKGFAKAGCATPTPKLDARLKNFKITGAIPTPTPSQYTFCPGQAFTLSLTFENTGDVLWQDNNQKKRGESVRLGFRSGDRLGLPTRISINTSSSKRVKPSRSTTFTLNAKARNNDAKVQSVWQLVSEGVAWFGPKATAELRITSNPPGTGQACQSTQLGECQAGTMRCKDGRLQCVPTKRKTVELCDNKDNDCDGQIDNNPKGTNDPCKPVDTACQQGRKTCQKGRWVCRPLPSCRGESSNAEVFTDASSPEQNVTPESPALPPEQRATNERSPERSTNEAIGILKIAPGVQGTNCQREADCVQGLRCVKKRCISAQGCGCATTLTTPPRPRSPLWLCLLCGCFVYMSTRRKRERKAVKSSFSGVARSKATNVSKRSLR